jgi:hypothetical protein
VAIIFSPTGQLDVSTDPSELPESGNGTDVVSGAMVRCKNLRLNENGKAKTRDGSAKLNTTAIATPIWWIEEQGGTRYSFAGEGIYSDESILESALTSAQWSAIQYNAFNETSLNVFALNGTDRKRIEDDVVYEWGIDAPTTAPTIHSGAGGGLTGIYKVRYTYARKVGSVLVTESDPSPASDPVQLTNASIGSASFDQPTDEQVTHIRFYRTIAGGDAYNFDQEIPIDLEYGYAFCFDWEEGTGNTVSEDIPAVSYGITFDWEGEDDEYLEGGSYKYTNTDAEHETENVYTWEARYTEAVNWAATISDDIVHKFGSSATLTTAVVEVTVTDPNGTPTYAWSKVSGDSISINSPTSASTSFRASGLALEETRTATFQCVVSDSPDSDTLTVDVTIHRNSTL